MSVAALIDGETIVATKDYQITPWSLSLANLDDSGCSVARCHGNRPSVTALINGVAAASTPVQVTFTASCGTVPACNDSHRRKPATVIRHLHGRRSCLRQFAGDHHCFGGWWRARSRHDLSLTDQATNIQFAVPLRRLSTCKVRSVRLQSDVVFKVVDVNGTALVITALACPLSTLRRR